MGGTCVVAIDGPGAAGKSTVARGVARALGFTYVDTGAMYRTLAWHCLRLGVDVADARAVGGVCRRWKTRLHVADGEPPEVWLLVEGYAPRGEIRDAQVSRAASDVAVMPVVRRWMKEQQRSCLQFGDLVMEGRDIATHVFPHTDFKFWLDASPDERVRRRQAQGVTEALGYRDRQDSQRATAPLMQGLGAVRLDTTSMPATEVMQAICQSVRQRREGRGE